MHHTVPINNNKVANNKKPDNDGIIIGF